MDDKRHDNLEACRSGTARPHECGHYEPSAGLAQQFRGLAEDIAAFVALQNTRLQRVVQAAGAGDETDEDDDHRRAEFERREQDLERRRRDALEHVEEECAQLTAAWDRLEAEQRRLLARGDAAAPPAALRAPQPEPTAPLSGCLIGDVDLIGGMGLPSASPAAAEPWSREPAAQQFQQMKREIRRHARRRRT